MCSGSSAHESSRPLVHPRLGYRLHTHAARPIFRPRTRRQTAAAAATAVRSATSLLLLAPSWPPPPPGRR